MTHEPTVQPNGAAIRAFREKEKLSVPELARFIGLRPQSVRNIENGHRRASAKVMRNLARVLAVPVEAITRDETDFDAEADPDDALAAAS